MLKRKYLRICFEVMFVLIIIVGGSLFLKGYTIDSLDPKKFWNNIPITEFPRYFDLVKDKIPNPAVVIPSARSVMFIFALSSLLLIYFFLYCIFFGVLNKTERNSIGVCVDDHFPHKE